MGRASVAAKSTPRVGLRRKATPSATAYQSSRGGKRKKSPRLGQQDCVGSYDSAPLQGGGQQSGARPSGGYTSPWCAPAGERPARLSVAGLGGVGPLTGNGGPPSWHRAVAASIAQSASAAQDLFNGPGKLPIMSGPDSCHCITRPLEDGGCPPRKSAFLAPTISIFVTIPPLMHQFCPLPRFHGPYNSLWVSKPEGGSTMKVKTISAQSAPTSC